MPPASALAGFSRSAPIPIAEATYENIGLLMGGAEPGHRATPHAEHLA